jgi:hypothetical protein
MPDPINTAGRGCGYRGTTGASSAEFSDGSFCPHENVCAVLFVIEEEGRPQPLEAFGIDPQVSQAHSGTEV